MQFRHWLETTGEDFLGTLLHDPSPSNLLIYADWLEERADPLAQYIRIKADLLTNTTNFREKNNKLRDLMVHFQHIADGTNLRGWRVLQNRTGDKPVIFFASGNHRIKAVIGGDLYGYGRNITEEQLQLLDSKGKVVMSVPNQELVTQWQTYPPLGEDAPWSQFFDRLGTETKAALQACRIEISTLPDDIKDTLAFRLVDYALDRQRIRTQPIAGLVLLQYNAKTGQWSYYSSSDPDRRESVITHARSRLRNIGNRYISTRTSDGIWAMCLLHNQSPGDYRLSKLMWLHPSFTYNYESIEIHESKRTVRQQDFELAAREMHGTSTSYSKWEPAKPALGWIKVSDEFDLSNSEVLRSVMSRLSGQQQS